VGRLRGALAARGTRRKYVHVGAMAASMPPTVPQSARTPHRIVCWWIHWRTNTPRQIVYWLTRWNSSHRPSQLVLARSPSRDPWRHGQRHGACTDARAACCAMVGGQGPCRRSADRQLHTWSIHKLQSFKNRTSQATSL